jgi:chaperonin GroES
MKLQPLGDRVVVKAQEDDEARTPSGLVIPDTAKEKPQTGEILAIGPGALNEDGDRMPMDVSVGDVVVYSKFGGTEIKVEGQEYLILSSRDLLAIVGG